MGCKEVVFNACNLAALVSATDMLCFVDIFVWG